jgi:ADP-ribosylglycohydrolase
MDPDREDRALGAVFGCALGDALGLPAEGCLKRILAERYPEGIGLPHERPVRDFPLNDWSDDTDHTVLVMRALVASRDEAADPGRDFAVRLAGWYDRGFPELGDTHGSGCGGMTYRVLRRPGFTEDPFGAARAIAGPTAGNGALMRTAPCAFTARPAEWAEYFCRTTHADPRCAASCAAQSVLIGELAATPHGVPVNRECLRRALEAARPRLGDVHWSELLGWAGRAKSLEALELDSRDARGYTFKAFAVALWAFRALSRAEDRDAALFKAVIGEIAMEGGDADTNAAIAGALVGAALGYRALPADWLEALPNRHWLEAECRAWLSGR